MNIDKNLISTIILLLSVIITLIYYNSENKASPKEFSPKVSTWLNKGTFYSYKNIYKLFYIKHEFLNNENLNESSSNLLFLHGFPTSSYDYAKLWNLFLNQNVKFKSMIAFDYLGFGLSEKPYEYEYSIFDMADMVDNLMMHLEIQKVSIISHDISDSILQELIRRDNIGEKNHFKIEKVVLLNGGIMTSIYKPLLSQDILRTNYIKHVAANYFFNFFFFQYSFSKIFGQLSPPTRDELIDFYMLIVNNDGNRVLPKTIEYMNERMQYGDVWYDALNETSIPAMFIYGPADPINPRKAFPQKFRQDLPNIKLSILSDFVGHYPQFEDPFTVFQLVNNFF